MELLTDFITELLKFLGEILIEKGVSTSADKEARPGARIACAFLVLLFITAVSGLIVFVGVDLISRATAAGIAVTAAGVLLFALFLIMFIRKMK